MNIHRLTEDEFLALKDDWTSLLWRSDADPLFLSWDWMYNWWCVYGGNAHDELLLLGAYEGSRLICLAPLYINRINVKRFISSRRVEFLGTRSSGPSGFRTEYLQFICDNNASEQALQAILSYIKDNIPFDEMYLADVIVGSRTHAALQQLAHLGSYYSRGQGVSQTYGIPCAESFAGYLDNLGSNSRLKLYNRRKVLEGLGHVTHTSVDRTNFEQTFDELADFHEHRWQARTFTAGHKEFTQRLIGSDSIDVGGVKVYLDARMIGCTFDLLCADRCYNFQMGFLENVDKKISTGTLVLGYAIERYFSDPRVRYYDLLAGEGKKSDYKARLGPPGSRFESLQVVGSPVLRYLYYLKDRVRAS